MTGRRRMLFRSAPARMIDPRAFTLALCVIVSTTLDARSRSDDPAGASMMQAATPMRPVHALLLDPRSLAWNARVRGRTILRMLPGRMASSAIGLSRRYNLLDPLPPAVSMGFGWPAPPETKGIADGNNPARAPEAHLRWGVHPRNPAAGINGEDSSVLPADRTAAASEGAVRTNPREDGKVDGVLFDPARLILVSSFDSRPVAGTASLVSGAVYSVTEQYQLGVLVPAAYAGDAGETVRNLPNSGVIVRNTFSTQITNELYAGVVGDIAIGRLPSGWGIVGLSSAALTVTPFAGLRWDANDLVLSASVGANTVLTARIMHVVSPVLSVGLEYAAASDPGRDALSFGRAQSLFALADFAHESGRYGIGIGAHLVGSKIDLGVRLGVTHNFRN
ncbi:hypothetical protein [Bradyrhizobium sp. STM 3809]|uniref:hypothetical protein n=1 Tax=Bradyrhizobium sp. STM 3809 TaxID=551936 RepID=UPI000240932E|nr:hypothetical protein [Bradyrhizobium sp. STM 3809]CCE01195.1 hypothetical protein BRAS3809_4380005 [Bradyrhizobium sp. STM 3809]